jgi:predicted AlkP superfamily phosphohydrolase/phosphomutase
VLLVGVNVVSRHSETTRVASADAPHPVLLIGLDGLEWNVLLPLVRQGKLPHLADLMRRGVFGELRTTRPTLSPIIWTSIATGKTRDQHGIRGFTRGLEGRLFHNRDRRTKAVWNVLSDYGRRVAVVGWYMTFPVEPIHGVMVSQTQTPDQKDRRQGRAIMMGRLVSDLPGQVHPEARELEIMQVRQRAAQELPTVIERTFGSFQHPLSLLTRTHWTNSTWSLEADLTFLSTAEHLLRQDEAYDVVLVYAASTDVLGHRFWRHHEPESFENPPAATEVEDFGHVLENYIRFLDDRIGRLVAASPREPTVVVVSDHGMHAFNPRADFAVEALPDDMNRVHSGHHRDAPPGVFVAAGPGIRSAQTPLPLERLQRADLADVGSIYDVTPTVLAMSGIPTGRDMQGRVLEEILAPGTRVPAAVASHDDAAWLAERSKSAGQTMDAATEAGRMSQLRALGYVQ